MIRVLLLDGHEIFYVGIESILASEDSIEFLGGFNSLEKVKLQIKPQAPDIILYNPTTLDNPDWLLWTKNLSTYFLEARLIVVLHTCKEVKKKPLHHKNIFGVISKKDIHQKLCEAVMKVYSGEKWISPCLFSFMFDNKRMEIDLTLKEIELLKSLVQSKKDREIANIMNISERTVRSNLQRLQDKIKVETRIEAVVWAVEAGIMHTLNSSHIQ